jgi:hypothetical protein
MSLFLTLKHMSRKGLWDLGQALINDFKSTRKPHAYRTTGVFFIFHAIAIISGVNG